MYLARGRTSEGFAQALGDQVAGAMGTKCPLAASFPNIAQLLFHRVQVPFSAASPVSDFERKQGARRQKCSLPDHLSRAVWEAGAVLFCSSS